jgi:hypothetical protein
MTSQTIKPMCGRLHFAAPFPFERLTSRERGEARDGGAACRRRIRTASSAPRPRRAREPRLCFCGETAPAQARSTNKGSALRRPTTRIHRPPKPTAPKPRGPKAGAYSRHARRVWPPTTAPDDRRIPLPGREVVARRTDQKKPAAASSVSRYRAANRRDVACFFAFH